MEFNQNARRSALKPSLHPSTVSRQMQKYPKVQSLIGVPNVSRIQSFTQEAVPIPAIYQALHRRRTPESKCLRFIMLTTCRPGEAVGLPPTEISDDFKLWELPQGRRKHKGRHRIPLTLPAQWLTRSRDVPLDGYIFHQPNGDNPIPPYHLNKELAAVGFPKSRVYDLRAAFKPWAEAQKISLPIIQGILGFDPEPIDLAIHREVLDAWAHYCTSKTRC